MKRAHFLTLVLGLVLVAGLLFLTSMGVGPTRSGEIERVFTDERPSSFSLNLGDPRASARGFLESVKAGLNIFGLVPKTEDEAALKALVEETKKQIAADAKKQEEQDETKKRRRRSLKESSGVDPERYEARPTPQRKADKGAETTFLGGGYGGGPVAEGPTHQSYMDEGLPQDAEGWLARIVSQRSYRVFTQFVALFKVGQISEDIFYSVVRELLMETDALLVKYGVLALTGAAETESFATLVEYRPQLPNDPEIYQLVRQGFQAYAEPAHLPYIFTFLRNPEESEIFLESVRVAGDSIRGWYLPASTSESEESPMGVSNFIYDQLHLALSEGLRKATTEDIKGSLQSLLTLMGGTRDEMVAGVDVLN